MPNPEDVAALVEKLIFAKNPPFRNIPDIESRLHYYLRKILPFRFYSNIYRRLVYRGIDLPINK